MTDEASFYDRAFFDKQGSRSLQSARVVLSSLFKHLSPARVVDVGCGIGAWLLAARELGAEFVIGVDGDYVDRSTLMIEPDCFVPADLTHARVPQALSGRAAGPFDLAVCLEVAEHLPFDRASLLIEDLTKLGDVVLFSAAVPYQFGANHVNEQWPEFWSILFRGQGFGCWDLLRGDLWADPRVDWWYAQNLLIFAREGSHAAALLPNEARARDRGLSLVHPENFLSNLLERPRAYGASAFGEELADLRALSAANLRLASKLPELAAIARAAQARPDARDVFPWTRSVLAAQADEHAAFREQIAEAERVAREQISHREEAECLAREQFAQREAAECLAREQFAQREGAERLAQEAVARREEVERLAREQFAQREDAERLAREAVAQREEAERLAQEAIAQREDAERFALEQILDLRSALAEQQEALRRAEERIEVAHKQHDAALRNAHDTLANVHHRLSVIQGSTIWRATAPLRQAGKALPAPIRRAFRGSAKVAWWSVTLQLRRKMTERRSAMRSGTVASQQPPSAPTAWQLSDGDIPAGHAVGSSSFSLPDLTIEARGNLENFERSIIAGAAEKLRRFRPFRSDTYLDLNPDVKAFGMDAAAHMLCFGSFEGRKAFRPEEIASVLGEYAGSRSADLLDEERLLIPAGGSRTVEILDRSAEICLYVSSLGNIFMKEIAEDLAEDIRNVGLNVNIKDEKSDLENISKYSIFVAPHEFFFLGRGQEWFRDDVISKSFMFSTEQVQTSWFSRSLPILLMARGVFDLCVQTADLLARAGVPALHLLPGARLPPQSPSRRDRMHPLFCALPMAAKASPNFSRPFDERPIDLSFFGASSPYRDRFFARNASQLAQFEAFLYCRPANLGPMTDAGEDSGLTRIAGHIAGHSKISLNVHRDEFGYFEWHRMVRLGMCAGSVVVSDPCLPHPLFLPGRHYFEERARYIPDLLEWLVRTKDGVQHAEKVRSNVDQLFAEALDPHSSIPKLLQFMRAQNFV